MRKYYSIFELSWNFSTFGGGGDSLRQMKYKNGDAIKLDTEELAEAVVKEILENQEWSQHNPKFVILPVFERVPNEGSRS